MDVIDVKENVLIGCCGAIKINRIQRCAQLVLIMYQKHISCSAKVVRVMRDMLGTCRPNPYNLRYITADVSGPFVSPEFIETLRRVGFVDAEDVVETDNPEGQWMVYDLSPRGETLILPPTLLYLLHRIRSYCHYPFLTHS
jgi:hypothetical protein